MCARKVGWCCLIAFLLLCSASQSSFASGLPPCDIQVAIARMARASNTSELLANQKYVGKSYVAQTVAAAKMFMFHPKSPQAADALLALIPKTNQQDDMWYLLYDPVCAGLSEADVRSLSVLSARLPSLLAAAVILKPIRLPQYIWYSFMSVGDPSNDDTVQMRRVCRAIHTKFVRAVNGLTRDDRAEFRTKVFDDKKCRPIHLPEDD